jgi:hypothetical protein
MKSLTQRLFERAEGKDVYDTCREAYEPKPSSTERLFSKINDSDGGQGQKTGIIVHTKDGRTIHTEYGANYSDQYGIPKWSEEKIVGPQREDLKWLFEKMSG